LEKIGVPIDRLRERLQSELDQRPKVHGAVSIFVCRMNCAPFSTAEKEMSKLKDEFTSAEHYLLALSAVPQAGFRPQNYLKNLASRATS